MGPRPARPATLALGILCGSARDPRGADRRHAVLLGRLDAAASTRVTETLVGAAAGLAARLVFAPVRVQPAKEAVGELSRQMADLLGQMAEGLAEAPDPKRAAE